MELQQPSARALVLQAKTRPSAAQTAKAKRFIGTPLTSWPRSRSRRSGGPGSGGSSAARVLQPAAHDTASELPGGLVRDRSAASDTTRIGRNPALARIKGTF